MERGENANHLSDKDLHPEYTKNSQNSTRYQATQF